MSRHHIWCNGVNALKAGEVSQAEIAQCPWCGGSSGLLANYPSRLSEAEMVNIVRIECQQKAKPSLN